MFVLALETGVAPEHRRRAVRRRTGSATASSRGRS